MQQKPEVCHEYYQSFTASYVDVLCIMLGVIEVIYENQIFCHFVSAVENNAVETTFPQNPSDNNTTGNPSSLANSFTFQYHSSAATY
jgi:hypothetical protein